ncbi:probable oligopeptide transporter (fragment) [Sporisorium scitamineum]|uniref:Probable oligopeptide transporter n=1 Tax=Sporisorium scitamineum TaxID=49012 RepID=A0A140KLW5_9BASI
MNSSGRPTTGKPTTGCPGTRGGAADLRPPTQGQGTHLPQQQDTYIEEEWDEEGYESEDDGDMFAFVPPNLGPAPELQHNPLDPSIDNQNRQQHADHATNRHVDVDAPAPDVSDQNETYYYDKATGAVYDLQGRLVVVSAQKLATAQPDAPLHAQVRGFQHNADARESPAYEITLDNVLAQSSTKPRMSTDHRSFDSASTFTRDPSGQPLNHARSYTTFPSMEALPEADSLPASRSGASEMRTTLPQGTRDIGITASGGGSLDQAIPVQGKRQSAQIDAFSSSLPELHRSAEMDDNLKYPCDSVGYAYNDVYKDDLHMVHFNEIGQGHGLVHPTHEGTEVGARGMRMVELEMDMEEDSPYPKVRASVSNVDDTKMPVNMLRMWFISIFLTILAMGANKFFLLPKPAPTFSSTVILLIAYPIGKLLVAIMPIHIWMLPHWLGSAEFSLNPGIYNIKEHAFTSIMASISIITAYGINVVIVLDLE